MGGSGGAEDPGTGGSGGAEDPGAGGSGGAEDPGAGGTGGAEDPGAGGTGGMIDPGTGGTGGTVVGLIPCAEDFCRAGEACVDNLCECDPDQPACPEGFFCHETHLRCLAEIPAQEWMDCEGFEGYQVRDLACASVSGSAIWLRPCSTHADCRMEGTFCPVEVDEALPAFCWINQCGALDPNIGAFPQNGELFGECDALYHTPPALENGKGTCFPGLEASTADLCIRNGTSTTSCRIRDRGAFRPEVHCAAGYTCQEDESQLNTFCETDADCPQPSMFCEAWACRPKPCRDDAACGSGAYCNSDDLCAPVGTCREVCNAGPSGADEGPYAGCSEGRTCFAEPESELHPGGDARRGLCATL